MAAGGRLGRGVWRCTEALWGVWACMDADRRYTGGHAAACMGFVEVLVHLDWIVASCMCAFVHRS